LFIKDDGSLWGSGSSEHSQLFSSLGTEVPTKLVPSGVASVALGGASTYYIRTNGSLWGVGEDLVGELGTGFESYFDLSVPIQIYPLPPITITNTSISSQTNLHLVGYCGLGGNYVLLTSTNLSQPRHLWSPVKTNLVSFLGASNYSVTVTNGYHANEPQRWYTLMHQ
jgi:hypothetical protein